MCEASLLLALLALLTLFASQLVFQCLPDGFRAPLRYDDVRQVGQGDHALDELVCSDICDVIARKVVFHNAGVLGEAGKQAINDLWCLGELVVKEVYVLESLRPLGSAEHVADTHITKVVPSKLKCLQDAADKCENMRDELATLLSNATVLQAQHFQGTVLC